MKLYFGWDVVYFLIDKTLLYMILFSWSMLMNISLKLKVVIVNVNFLGDKSYIDAFRTLLFNVKKLRKKISLSNKNVIIVIK